MPSFITGDYVWITQGPHAQKYGVVMSFTGVYVELKLPNEDIVIVPVAWCRKAVS